MPSYRTFSVIKTCSQTFKNKDRYRLLDQFQSKNTYNKIDRRQYFEDDHIDVFKNINQQNI